MTDQPPTNHRDHDPTTDHEAVVASQPPTDLNQPAEEQVSTPPLISLEEAAAALGITVNAVRQRIKRGTVVATKTEAGWLVDLVATNQRHGEKQSSTTTTNQPTNHVVDPTDQQPTTDLTPLAEVIREQHQQIAEQANRIAELSAVAAMWQTRAMHLEEQLKQLSATAESTDEVAESPETNEPGDQDAGPGAGDADAPAGVWERVRRWIAGE